MSSSFDKLICQFDIVFQRVLLPHWVRHVTCVGDGSFNYATCCSSSLHTQHHVRQVVQRIEDTEDVHAVLLGHLAEPYGGSGRGDRVSRPTQTVVFLNVNCNQVMDAVRTACTR